MNVQRLFVVALLTLAIITLAGCDDGDPDFPFDEGEFQIFTLLVDDQCLDGGLNPLFMPQGTEEPWAWPHLIRVYPPSALPQTYDLTLRPPFHEMSVTAERVSSTEQQLTVHPNPSVLIGPEQFGDCAVELSGTVHVDLTGSDQIEGVASLNLSDPGGDERCPADMPTSCAVLLSFEGTRGAP